VSRHGTENFGEPPDFNLINWPFLLARPSSPELMVNRYGRWWDWNRIAGREAGSFEGIKQVAARDGRSLLI
jgi:hypothetical protein